MREAEYVLHGIHAGNQSLEIVFVLLPVIVVAGALLVSRLRSSDKESGDGDGETSDSYGDEPV